MCEALRRVVDEDGARAVLLGSTAMAVTPDMNAAARLWARQQAFPSGFGGERNTADGSARYLRMQIASGHPGPLALRAHEHL